MPKRLPDGWRQSFCTLIREGYTLSDAAVAARVAPGTVRRRMADDPEFRELYREAREAIRDTLRNEIWKLRHSENESTARWAYDHLIRWNLPEAKESHRLEITGDGGGPVVLSHERRLTLADVYAAGSLEGRDGGALLELPAASEVLPEPDSDQRSAG